MFTRKKLSLKPKIHNWLLATSALVYLILGPQSYTGWKLFVAFVTLAVFMQAFLSLSSFYLLAWKNRRPILLRVSVEVQLNPLLWWSVRWSFKDKTITVLLGPVRVNYLTPPPKARKTTHVERRHRLTVVRGIRS